MRCCLTLDRMTLVGALQWSARLCTGMECEAHRFAGHENRSNSWSRWRFWSGSIDNVRKVLKAIPESCCEENCRNVRPFHYDTSFLKKTFPEMGRKMP